MLITLNREIFAIVEFEGAPMVIVQRGPRMWRPARPALARSILAGLTVPVVRIVDALRPIA